jgi:hypothetical protein
MNIKTVILTIIVAFALAFGVMWIGTAKASEPTFYKGNVATVKFKAVKGATNYVVYEKQWNEKGTKLINVRKKAVAANEKKQFSVLRDDVVDGHLVFVKAYRNNKRIGKTQYFDFYRVDGGLKVF